MFNKTIFKQTLKANFRLWLIFTVAVSILGTVLIAVFDDSTIGSLSNMVEGTPLENLLQQTTFLGMLSQTFFTIHGVLLPIIYIVMTANSLVAAKVDRGSMAYLLSTPIKRKTIIFTNAIYLIFAVFLMIAVETIIGLAAIKLFQSDLDFNLSDYLLLNTGLFLLMVAISNISFFFSCLFNMTKHSLALGAGIPLAFFLFQLMRTVDSSLDNLKYFTINALFDTNAILEGEGYTLNFVVLAGISIIFYLAGTKVFKEKDLPL